MPLSSCCFLWSRCPALRFHAWQAFYVGLSYIVLMVCVTVTEVCLGLCNRQLGQMVNGVGPVVMMGALLVWGYCVMCLIWKGSCRLPLFGQWATRKAEK